MGGPALQGWKGSSFLKHKTKEVRKTFIDKFKGERDSSNLKTSIASKRGKTWSHYQWLKGVGMMLKGDGRSETANKGE